MMAARSTTTRPGFDPPPLASCRFGPLIDARDDGVAGRKAEEA
jgi:hypothetical protein